MCLRVASSVTALAPFSQNSAVCRCSGEGSGQAQPWQSKPSTWLSLSRVFVARRTPICSIARFIVTATAEGPAARSLEWPTASCFSSMSRLGGLRLIRPSLLVVPTGAPEPRRHRWEWPA